MKNVQQTIYITPIGIIHSCFKEKFGIPRQPGLVKDAPAILELYPEFAREEAVRELDGFSHIWLLFMFHQNIGKNWSPMVRPPRLGGNRKVGVFASRSPVRPNPVGMSAVELDRIEINKGKVLIHLKGIDILDQTPVIDIKPYIPYSDIINSATGGFANKTPETEILVEFSEKASNIIRNYEKKLPDLKNIISQMLKNDPRPAYLPSQQNDHDKIYGAKLFDFDVKWRVENNLVTVIDLALINQKP